MESGYSPRARDQYRDSPPTGEEFAVSQSQFIGSPRRLAVAHSDFMLTMLKQSALQCLCKALCIFYPTCSEIGSALIQRLGDGGWSDGLGWMLQSAHTMMTGIPLRIASPPIPA
jgi:hypothetical protein